MSVSHAALTDNGYYTWITPLAKKQKYTVSVTYPNDAFAFNAKKEIKTKDPKREAMSSDERGSIVAMLVTLGVIVFAVGLSYLRNLIGWVNSSGFKATKTEIKSTVIEYYPNCPNCGAPRPAGRENCEYCGTNFIKSEKKVEEANIPKNFSQYREEIMSHKKDGIYPLVLPNTSVRVRSVTVPNRTSFSSYVKSVNASRGGGGHSCAHSSCACACASSGRAGCSVKDFFKESIYEGRVKIESKRAR